MAVVYYKFPNSNELYTIDIGKRENISIKELSDLIIFSLTGGRKVGFTVSLFSEETKLLQTIPVGRNRTLIVKRVPIKRGG